MNEQPAAEPARIAPPALPLRGRIFALVTAAGTSTRFSGAQRDPASPADAVTADPSAKKEFVRIGGLTVLEQAAMPFLDFAEALVITCTPGSIDACRALLSDSPLISAAQARGTSVEFAEGGSTRQESVLRGLEALAAMTDNGRADSRIADKGDLVLIHDGARPWISKDLIQKIIERTRQTGACLPLMPLVETPKIVNASVVLEHPLRASVMTAQTPQAFAFPHILKAHRRAARENYQTTDDAMIWDRYVGPVSWLEGERMNRKITYREDLGQQPSLRVGQGWDIHPLVEGRRLLLAGVEIDSPRGEYGHSDGDVLWHAVIDALLGAASLGDIGTHFPPSDPQWKNADSTDLAARVMDLLGARGWKPVNIDCTVILESPRLAPYRPQIVASLARVLDLPQEAVSFKAKTREGFDAAGKGEAIEAQAIVLLSRELLISQRK